MKNIEVNLYQDRYAYNETLIKKEDLISTINSKGLHRTPESWWERIY
jgi:hypothetical protein